MITVKFFASLRERMGHAETALAVPEPATVGGVWAAVAGESRLGDGILAALNHEYVDADSAVSDGDEVAFFPPVTGG